MQNIPPRMISKNIRHMTWSRGPHRSMRTTNSKRSNDLKGFRKSKLATWIHYRVVPNDQVTDSQAGATNTYLKKHLSEKPVSESDIGDNVYG